MPKKTLVILPGFAGDAETWEKFIEEAKNDFSITLIEIPCFGKTACDIKMQDMPAYLDFVEKEIKNIKDDKISLLCHSFGGNVAIGLLLQNRIKVEKLVLLATPLLYPKSKIRKFIIWVIKKVGDCFFKIPIVEKLGITIREIVFFRFVKNSKTKNKVFKSFIDNKFGNDLKKIKVPTLIIWGALDVFAPFTKGLRINKLIDNSKIHIMWRSGHMLQVHRTQKTLNLIKNFVCGK